MALTPEGKVKAKVVKILREEGIYYFFPATHGYGRSGVPDVICCVAGRFLGIECKAGTNKPTALQVHEIEQIRSSGGVAVVVARRCPGPCIALAGFWQQAPLKRGYEPHHPCHVGRSHWRSIALRPVPCAAD